MDRTETEKYITETYGAAIEYPWLRYPEYAVFRHNDNRKWFAVLMAVSGSKLGLAEDKKVNIINLKTEPAAVGSLRMQPGFFPAYHMNKNNWITVSLDGGVSDGELKMLLDISFRLTSGVGSRR